MVWKKIDGIYLYQVNRAFKKLANSKLSIQKQIRDNILTVYLPKKQVREITTYETKKHLLENIKQLDGFESFKISILEDCSVKYREHPTNTGVLRWLEIPVQNVFLND